MSIGLDVGRVYNLQPYLNLTLFLRRPPFFSHSSSRRSPSLSSPAPVTSLHRPQSMSITLHRSKELHLLSPKAKTPTPTIGAPKRHHCAAQPDPAPEPMLNILLQPQGAAIPLAELNSVAAARGEMLHARRVARVRANTIGCRRKRCNGESSWGKTMWQATREDGDETATTSPKNGEVAVAAPVEREIAAVAHGKRA
ncbi:hypothetical protein HN51_050249 [Arachis hypogaea]